MSSLITIIWPLLIALVGLFMYFSIANPKWNQVGFVLFCVGTFWTVYLLTGQDFSIAHTGRR